MKRRIFLLSFFTFYFLLFTLVPSGLSLTYAQTPCDSIGWSSDPSQNLNVSPWGQSPRAVSDGQGGVFIMWQINSFNTFQYLQHVDRCGIIQWPAPVVVRGEWNGCRFYPDLAEDGFGGALVSYTEQNVSGPQSGEGRVRVNRMDENGNLLWGAYGVRVSLLEQNQSSISKVVPDGEGGAIVSFGIPDDSLYIQRISANGGRLWGDYGIMVTDTSNLNFDHLLVPDGSGGAIIQWYGYDTGFKRFDSQGNELWHTPSPHRVLYYSQMLPDGNGGAVLGGEDRTSAPIKIIANRLSPDGVLVWGQNGLMIEDSLGNRSTVTDIHLRVDSVITVFWTNVRDIFNKDYTAMIQFITPQGQFVFPGGSIPISGVSNKNFSNHIVASDDTTLLFVWIDLRSMNNDFGDLYLQRLDSIGIPLWDTTDVLLTNQDFSTPSSISDNMGGVITVWSDEPLHGIFAQQVSKNGNLGEVLDDTTGIISQHPHLFPDHFKLYQNYPNPFNSSTIIRFYLSTSKFVRLRVFNLLGQEIKSLIHGKLTPGNHEVLWEGKNDSGAPVASGIYLYRLSIDNQVTTRKMLLVR